MNEVLYDRIKENLEALKMRNTIEILDNYLERTIKDDLNIVDVLDSKLSHRVGAIGGDVGDRNTLFLDSDNINYIVASSQHSYLF